MHYFKREIGDYYKKAGRLSMLEHGACTLLTDACYDREQFPTLQEALDWTWASSEEEIQAVTFVLSRLFRLEDGIYINDEIQNSIDKYHKNATTNQRIAREREQKRKVKLTNGVDNSTNRAQGVDESLNNSNESPPNQEPLTINHKPITIKEKKPSQSEIDIDDIFKFWKLTLNKTETAKLTKERKKKILDRLNENYTVEEIKHAITGCTQSAYHMGKNENGKIYDSLELILRSGENLEKFIGYNTTILQVNNNATNQSNANGKQTNGIRRTRTPTTTARIWDNQES